MTRDEVLEVMARALFNHNPNRNKALQWDHGAAPRKRYRRAGAAALTALEARGMAVVKADRLTILETALERIAGMDSAGADVRAHCETALRRARG